MTIQEIIDWLKQRCEDNKIAFGTDKWNSDMEELLEKLTVEKPVADEDK